MDDAGAEATRLRRILYRAAVVWLLIVQPVALALALDPALPRLATFDPADWLVVVVRIGVVVAGMAVGLRLRAHSRAAWRAVAFWACASMASTMLSQARPALPAGRAPSEARIVAAIAVARDALVALGAARLARARRDGRDSS
jgi:hypothetical protein